MTSEEKEGWGYVRLSQRGRDGSLDEQLETIRLYGRDRDDIRLVTTLNEGNKTSGFNQDRPKYLRLLEKIRNEEIDAVIVRDRARLSRDFDERLRLILDFRETDVELHVVEAGGYIDLQDVQTAAMEAIHAAMDHVKKMMEIQRSKDATEERLEAGYDHGRPPHGLQFDDEGQYWVPGENYYEALRVLSLRDQNESYRSIQKELGVNREVARKIEDRRERYESFVDGASS